MTQAEYLAYELRRKNSAASGLPDTKPQCFIQHESQMKIRPSTDVQKLNKTEHAYLQYIRGYDYVWIGIQNITLKLADDTRFTPDFCTIDRDGNLRFIDVKGFQREDALIKVKVAARLFPFAEFVIVKKNGALWDHEYIKP